MPDVVKLKKKAAELELKKQFDKALAIYVGILDGYSASDDDVDVALYNRVGDLYLKQGNTADAVDYYEQAVDRYAEGGFFNNAIALCNKILRSSPGRASVYYKLGKISAQKGFKSDAKVNFLEYADRMQQVGKIDESFRALKEFADLCPDQDDIRLMLAEQLAKKDRKAEAIEQLQLLHERYAQEGREIEARAAFDRMKAIDPSAEPRTGSTSAAAEGGGLVFLDLGDATRGRAHSAMRRAVDGLDILDTGEQPRVASGLSPAVPAASAPASAPASAAPASASPARPAPPPEPELLEMPSLEPAVLDAITQVEDHTEPGALPIDSGLLDGLETTSLGGDSAAMASGSLLDFEPTSFTPPVANPSVADELLVDFDLPRGESAEAPELLDMDFDADVGSEDEFASPPGELPMLTDDLPMFADDLPIRSDDLPMLTDDLPMLVDDDAATVEDDDEHDVIGGDLELFMPGDDASESADATDIDDSSDTLPLLDFELPMPGEAERSLEPVSPPASESFEDTPADPDDDHESQEDDLRLTDPELAIIPTPPAARRSSTLMAEQSVELLQALVDDAPEDFGLRRRLAETMLESGDRQGGLRELEVAMVGFERGDDLVSAAKIADEIVLLHPDSVRHHQKRVEYAFRTNEGGRLIDAYLELADALFRAGQVDKSRAIYQRVIDLSPDDLRAQTALESFPAIEEPAPTAAARQRPSSAVIRPSQGTSTAAIPGPRPDDEGFVNLGDWLRDDEAPKDTRMIVEEKEPSGDEEADFQEMLRKFKQGIAENVEDEDHQSHYDLGVAFKEMGLVDEAIAEFQKALRAPSNRVPTYEMLGQCFMDKKHYPMAATILSRALSDGGLGDNQLVGVLYLLGRAAEERGQHAQAVEYYSRVFVVDIQFRDIGERLSAAEGAAR